MSNRATHTDTGVEDLDGAALRAAVSGLSVTALEVARDRYAVAHQWCLTHPPAAPSDAATFGEARLPGMGSDCDLRVGGEGTPGVAVFAVEAYAATARVSTGTAVQILSDALDLQHRLRRTWARVVALEVPAWVGARIAQMTTRLSLSAVNWIDQELERAGSYSWKRIETTIKHAVAKFHPELIRSPEVGKDDWDVRIDHDGGCGEGTSRLDAVGDSVDLEKFHQLIRDEAAQLGSLGDPDTFEQRKAKALGVLADRHATHQGTLNLDGDGDGNGNGNGDGDEQRTGTGTHEAGGKPQDDPGAPDHGDRDGAGPDDPASDLAALLADAQEEAEAAYDAAKAARAASVAAGFGNPADPRTGSALTRVRSYLRPKLYLHLSLADLTADLTNSLNRSDSCAHQSVVDTGRLGPQLLSVVKQWLSQCGSIARITPVIDLNRQWAVDQHDPPETMREQAILRDEHCVFPYCTVDARSADLDHIVAYDPHGPPGQTSPDNLACLCRGHHRMKTFTDWAYVREPSGCYLWTDPHGQRWRVVPGQGTTPLASAAEHAAA